MELSPANFDENTINADTLSEIPLFHGLVDIEVLGSSAWARSYRISVQSQNGDSDVYFMKISLGLHGQEALKGEYESTFAIHSVQGEFVPRPMACGSFKKIPNAHYYICKFFELSEELPEPLEFCKKVAALHSKSTSPNGKFGFHVVTYNGDLPQANAYTESWEDCFTNGFHHMIKLNVERGGPWTEIDELRSEMASKVIPRLLRPLESNGRSVKPSLVHGDLWCGNTAVDRTTGLPLVYDPSSFYAHNEYELGNWRPDRNKFTQIYFDAYHQHFPKAKPVDDYDDRNALYAIRYNLHAAALFPDMTDFREMVVEEMKRLIAKYPGGYEDYRESFP